MAEQLVEAEDQFVQVIEELKEFTEKHGLRFTAAAYDEADNLRSIIITDVKEDRDELLEDLKHWYKDFRAFTANRFDEGELM